MQFWNFRRQKIFVGKHFRHLTKISSLFADEVFTDKVLGMYASEKLWVFIYIYIESIKASLDSCARS